MSAVPLAHKYSAETYDQALTNLVERWEREGGEGPIKYDEAAIGMDKSTVSTALKFLGEIGLLDVPKAGNYNVPEEVVDFKTKMGAVQREAKQNVESRISEYALYSEATFLLGVNDFTLDELVEEVAGSSEVAASKDEVSDVKRSLKILAELGFLEIDEEGNVSIPAGLKDGDDGAKSSPDGQSQDSEDGEEQVDRPLTEFNEENGEPQETVERVRSQSMSQSRLAVDVDISMDVTEMKTNEVKEKLETINDVLGEHEE